MVHGSQEATSNEPLITRVLWSAIYGDLNMAKWTVFLRADFHLRFEKPRQGVSRALIMITQEPWLQDQVLTYKATI